MEKLKSEATFWTSVLSAVSVTVFSLMVTNIWDSFKEVEKSIKELDSKISANLVARAEGWVTQNRVDSTQNERLLDLERRLQALERDKGGMK